MVQKGAIVLEYVPSDSQVVNILMKPLAKRKFEMLWERLGLVEIREHFRCKEGVLEYLLVARKAPPQHPRCSLEQ